MADCGFVVRMNAIHLISVGVGSPERSGTGFVNDHDNHQEIISRISDGGRRIAVNQAQIINVARELRGMPIIFSESGQKHGQVSDAIVHTTEGSLMGLVISFGGSERLLVADDFYIFGSAGAVIVAEDAHLNMDKINAAIRDGVRVCRNLIGAEAITKSGRLLGRVTEVYVLEEQLLIIYRVASSWLQEMFGGGFFIAGNLPHAWSRNGARLIVKAEAPGRSLFSSLDEAICFAQRRLAFAGDEQ
ncbi:MAG: PRC-barrel domain-containing protein [Acidobacteriota bacterium]